MSTVSAIFERLGGPAKVGRAIGKSTEHATIMRRRGSIPVRYWPALMAANGEGARVTYADLVAAHTPPDPSPAPSDFTDFGTLSGA